MRISKSPSSSPSAVILLVDDNRMGLAARRAVLQELGHTVVTAVNGQDALGLTEAQSFDLVITDWKMPKLDGIELIRELRNRLYPAPIVLLSGFADSSGLHESESGADVVVQKSANEVQVLISTVKRLLTRKALRKGPASQLPAKATKAKGKAS
ncbi:response regulator [Bryobacter aggregatus]|uniref:response regulator n=1 Tax=Bryobacter aggregatus TaxID=360054 RepID=UPI002351E4BF|nr:response regulator [Bryobacter aggregatus]